MDQLSIEETGIAFGEENKEQLKVELENLESPFTWLPDRSTFSQISQDWIIKTNTPKNKDKGLEKYVKYMHLVYELGHIENEAALKRMEEWKCSFAEDIDDDFFVKHHPALNHVLRSSEAYLLYEKGEYAKAATLVEEFKKLSVDKDFQATICGLKAMFFHIYGIKGHETAKPCAEKAMALCEDEVEWIYITASTLRDIRRSELYNTEGTDDSLSTEFKLFKKLVDLKQKPEYLIRLGNTCHDLSTCLRARHKYCRWSNCSECEQIRYYNKEGIRCFKESLKVKNPERETYLRLITGINGAHCSVQQRNKNFARELVESLKSFEEDNENDTGSGYYAIGKYYYNLERDKKMAEEYFKKAEKDLIILKYKSNGGKYNPCHDINERMKKYPDKPKILESLCQIASYHLFIEKDLMKTIKDIEEVIKVDPTLSSLYIKKHKSWFQRRKCGYLLELTVNEVLLDLKNQNGTIPTNCDSFIEFVKKLETIAPELCTRIKSCLRDVNTGPGNIDPWSEKRTSSRDWNPKQNVNKNQFSNWRDECKKF